MHRQRDARPILVTSARPSLVEDRQARQRRYLWSMGLRTVCFVLAVALFHGAARWGALAASAVLPWVAVLVANAGPKHETAQPAYFIPDPAPALEAAPEPEPSTADSRQG